MDKFITRTAAGAITIGLSYFVVTLVETVNPAKTISKKLVNAGIESVIVGNGIHVMANVISKGTQKLAAKNG